MACRDGGPEELDLPVGGRVAARDLGIRGAEEDPAAAIGEDGAERRVATGSRPGRLVHGRADEYDGIEGIRVGAHGMSVARSALDGRRR